MEGAEPSSRSQICRPWSWPVMCITTPPARPSTGVWPSSSVHRWRLIDSLDYLELQPVEGAESAVAGALADRATGGRPWSCTRRGLSRLHLRWQEDSGPNVELQREDPHRVLQGARPAQARARRWSASWPTTPRRLCRSGVIGSRCVTGTRPAGTRLSTPTAGSLTPTGPSCSHPLVNGADQKVVPKVELLRSRRPGSGSRR